MANWFTGNWFQALQATGILAGLLFTGLSLRLNIRLQRAQTLINITQQHRSLWLKLFDVPNLRRVLSPKLPRRHKITFEERLFTNLLILHITSTLYATRQGIIQKPEGLDADLRELFSLPIPRAIWNESKHLRDKRTIRYIEALINAKK